MGILSKGGNNVRSVPSVSVLKENPEFSLSEDPCDKLSFTTSIHPREPGVKALKVKDLVGVELGGNNRIEIYNKDGELCGFLLDSVGVRRLINCMKNGYKFSGVIVWINLPTYDVKIYPLK